MSLDYFYDSQAQLIRIIGHGAVSVNDRTDFILRLLNDPDLLTPSGILIDVRGVTNALTVEDIYIIGKLIEKLQSWFRGPVAIVNASVGHVTLSHLISFSVGDGASQVQVFVSQSEALAWLRS